MKDKVKFFAAAILSLGFAVSQTHAESGSNLSGLWEETVLDPDYDEDTKDMFYISNFRDQWLINAVNYPDYAVGQVKRDGRNLTFTMANFNDPNETYVLKYECREIVPGKKLKCKFTNQNNEIEPEIIWEKQNINREITMQQTGDDS